MRMRIITAAILLPLLFLVIVSPYPLLFTAVYLAAAILLAREILLFSPVKIETRTWVISYTLIAAVYVLKYLTFFLGASRFPVYEGILLILFLSFFAVAISYLFSSNFEGFFHNAGFATFTVLYAGVILSFGIELRFFHFINPSQEQGLENFLRGLFKTGAEAQTGALYIFFVLTVAWIYDAGAYFIGMAFGKVKIGLAASPNKSWAGFAGGIVFAVLAYFAFDWVCNKYFETIYESSVFHGRPYWNIGLTIAIALLAQAGDLVESIMKRAAGKKDSGTLIAGHGGIFDAIDSAIPTSFLFYGYISMVHYGII